MIRGWGGAKWPLEKGGVPLQILLLYTKIFIQGWHLHPRPSSSQEILQIEYYPEDLISSHPDWPVQQAK